ncbi:hypothetical protein H4R19_001758 [Coemansia spiralis]|nr:hypothetical protein H4R19_001758 [Coemansia spiralis]
MGPSKGAAAGPAIPAALAKALADRLYDKQRLATQKVEQLVRAALEADDDEAIYAVVAELATEFATSEREQARIGGLVALAATAVALTHINIRPFLPHMVPPIVSALSDGESKVRYFACESLYNVAKVSQGHILRWFNDIFDGLARVTADSVKSVKDGADYLDRMLKDIVAEQAATCLDWYGAADSSGADGASPTAKSGAGDGAERDGPRLAFALDAFVPLLAERMHTYKPSTRLYLIEWIRVLESVPGLDLIVYLPEFLDGLLRFLSDPNDDVRTKTQSLLGELLGELRECVELREADSDVASWHEGSADGDAWSGSRRGRSTTVQSAIHAEGRFAEEDQALSPPAPRTHTGAPPTAAATTAATAAALGVLDGQRERGRRRSGSQGGHQWASRSAASLMASALGSGQFHGVTDELRMAARRRRIRAARAGSAVQPGANVDIDFARCVAILVPHIESNDQEIQLTALSWMSQLSWLCPEVIVAAIPALVNAVLPAVSHPMPGHRHTAEELYERLYGLVKDSPDPVRRRVYPDPAGPPPGPTQQQQQQPARQRLSFVDRARPLTPVTSITTTTAAASAASHNQRHPRPLSPSEADGPNGRSRTGSLLQASVDSGPASAVPSIAATARSESPDEALPVVAVAIAEPEAETEPEVAEPEADEGTVEVVEAFDYDQAATAIMELFAKNVHAPTKVAGMHWLLLLHRKAPWRILTPDDMSFPVLLKMLGDSSEQVVKLDLELFAQISQHAQGSDAAPAGAGYSVDPRNVPYLARFLGSLLQMFATDRALLETRAALMVRQLCVVLDPLLVFGLFAKLLILPHYTPTAAARAAPAEPPWTDAASDSGSGDVFSFAEGADDDGPQDVEFVSVMVQHLSWILVTAPEAEPLRTVLRRYSSAIALAPPPLTALRQALYGQPAARTQPTPAVGGRARGGSGSGSAAPAATAPDGQAPKQSKLVRGAVPGPAGSSSGSSSGPRSAVPLRGAAVGARPRSGPTDGERARAKTDAGIRGAVRRPNAPPALRLGEAGEQQQPRQAQRAREVLLGAVEHVERRAAQNQQSHELFGTLFRTWSHNPAACLTLCLQSQHYEMAAELVGIFGQLAQDLTVSFLVQLDKLVQLIESPIFAYLRLQLLDPQFHPMLVRALYGLLMLLPQSSAFAILRNRLGSVSAMSFAAPQLPAARPWSPAADPAAARQLHYHFHYHSHPGTGRTALLLPAQPLADPAQLRAGAQLASALGVPPAEIAELTQQLAACGQAPAAAFLGADDEDEDDVAALLREMAALHLGATDDGTAPDTGEASPPPRPAPTAPAADAALLSEYRAVRRRHALALRSGDRAHM